jgi:putative transposase
MNPDPKESLPREILEELMEEGAEAFRSVLEKLVNLAMELERSEFLGAGPYERTSERRDHANGFKDKTMATRVGRLKLKIPQVRHLSFYPKSLERGCRSEKALKLAIAEMYVKGVSTRKVTQIKEQLCGTEISATQVSRIAKLLDEELEQFRERELGEYRVVYLDAHYEKVRVNGTVQDLAILKALGVNRWGKREVLGVSATLSEAEIHWREFLQALQRRGLKGVELVVSDDHVGLRAARRAVFPSVPWQRCQFHLAQNAQAHAHNRAQAREMGQAIRDIFNCPSLADAEAMLGRVAERFAKENPKWVKWLEQNLAEGFTVYRFARRTHRKIRTVNGLERINKEIRRRTRVVGIFPNEDSVLRLTSAVLAEIHEEWLTGRQYLNLADWSTTEKPASQPNYRKSVA